MQVTVGLLATFTSVMAVIAADTGAYLIGRAVGRTQLTKLSPKKTVEGAIGGGCRAGPSILANHAGGTPTAVRSVRGPHGCLFRTPRRDALRDWHGDAHMPLHELAERLVGRTPVGNHRLCHLALRGSDRVIDEARCRGQGACVARSAAVLTTA